MRIPMTQIQTASAAAVPQQSSRNAAAQSAGDATPDAKALDTTERAAESQESGDRDAQEQYIASDGKRRPKPPVPASESTADSSNGPLWNLSVSDDAPPADLDLLG
jgi:hypothetical protein